jgi:hypothetical protein
MYVAQMGISIAKLGHAKTVALANHMRNTASTKINQRSIPHGFPLSWDVKTKVT